ncbi:hypothetical protein [Peijinzhouia sedimentorum]
MKKYLFLLILFVFVYKAEAQQQTKIGLNLLIEQNTSGTYFEPGIGLSIERQITKRSGIESGLYYRTTERSLYTSFYDQPNILSISYIDIYEHFLSLPILYKFHSRIVNFAVGPTMDYFVGWNQASGNSQVEVADYNISPDLSFGAMLKLSKAIRLGEKASLEPEVRINPNFTYGIAYLGFGIPLKFRID